CDGQRPECGRCKGYGFTCTWIRRKRSSAVSSNTGPMRELPESTTQPVIERDVHVPCSYIVKPYEALIRSIQTKMNQTDQAALDLTLASIRQSLPEELGEHVLLGTDQQQPKTPVDERSPTYVGQVSDLYFFKTIESRMRYNAVDFEGDDLREQYYDQTEIPENTTFLGRLLLCPSEEDGLRYLDIYFSTIHIAYPFLSKSLMFEQFRRLRSKNFEDRDQHNRSMLALLNFVFAIGSYYLSFPHDENERSQSYFQYFEQGVYFSNELMAKCNLVNVWTSLVRCFFLLAVCQTDRCWNTLGFAIRMAQSIGLHVDTPPPRKGLNISLEIECELRRRTWYSMYVLDRLLALQLGRPLAIHQEDFHVTLPSHFENDNIRDSSENAETPSKGRGMTTASTTDYFLHVIRFSSIVEHVVRELYQPIQPEVSADKVLSDASIIDASLLEWRSSLPHHLRFDFGHTFEKSVVFKRQRNMLAIKFHHLRALVNRPFLALPVLQHNNESFMALLQRSSAQIQDAESKCIAAAQQTAHLLHNVSNERDLVQDFPWWQMISCLICAGSILFVAEVFSGNHQRSSELSGYLHEDAETCLKVFEALSVKSPAANQAVGMLKSLVRLRSVSGGNAL
ncbi:hypothetical protein EIK77_002491, partial [Talaromyces pinophilus]